MQYSLIKYCISIPGFLFFQMLQNSKQWTSEPAQKYCFPIFSPHVYAQYYCTVLTMKKIVRALTSWTILFNIFDENILQVSFFILFMQDSQKLHLYCLHYYDILNAILWLMTHTYIYSVADPNLSRSKVLYLLYPNTNIYILYEYEYM